MLLQNCIDLSPPEFHDRPGGMYLVFNNRPFILGNWRNRFWPLTNGVVILVIFPKTSRKNLTNYRNIGILLLRKQIRSVVVWARKEYYDEAYNHLNDQQLYEIL